MLACLYTPIKEARICPETPDSSYPMLPYTWSSVVSHDPVFFEDDDNLACLRWVEQVKGVRAL
jgi:hypothetical protein